MTPEEIMADLDRLPLPDEKPLTLSEAMRVSLAAAPHVPLHLKDDFDRLIAAAMRDAIRHDLSA